MSPAAAASPPSDPSVPDPLLHAAIIVLAFLYSSVGHAGASGYIAAMSLAGVAVPEIRPAALVLNLGVAGFGIWHFVRGGHFRGGLAWPFLLPALPAAWLGARLELPVQLVSLVLGAVLLFSAIRFLLPLPRAAGEPEPPAWRLAVPVGAALGFLAGLTGTGGGIFLTPLLLLAGWATPKTAAAASIVFIAGNSLAGLAGFAAGGEPLPWHHASLLPFALAGGFAGSRMGSYHFSPAAIRRLLAAVLLVASAKLVHRGLVGEPAIEPAALPAETSA